MQCNQREWFQIRVLERMRMWCITVSDFNLELVAQEDRMHKGKVRSGRSMLSSLDTISRRWRRVLRWWRVGNKHISVEEMRSWLPHLVLCHVWVAVGTGGVIRRRHRKKDIKKDALRLQQSDTDWRWQQQRQWLFKKPGLFFFSF